MSCIEVETREEFRAAVGRGDCVHVRFGEWTASGSAQVTAYGSAQVRAYDSAQVTAYDSAQVTAYGSAQVRAYDSAQVTAYDSAQVTAAKFVAVTIHGETVAAEGGVHVRIPAIETAENWCDFYGIEAPGGVATLYKAVRDNFRSYHGADYTPGSTPEAYDWDGGKEECGGGLHFSPRPFMALVFDDKATRFVACPVKLSDMRSPTKRDNYPEKIKARRVCAPCWEVDQGGNRIGAKTPLAGGGE